MPYQLPHINFFFRKPHFKFSNVRFLILILDSRESGGGGGGEGEEREVNLMRDWKDLEFSLD